MPKASGMTKSQSTPSMGSKVNKVQATSGKGGRLAWVQAEVLRAEKALLATSDQMKQDAHQFMLSSVINASSKNATKLDVEAKEAKEKRKEKRIKKINEVTIPDDFFLSLASEVERHIDHDKSPRGTPSTVRSSPARPYKSPVRPATNESGRSTPFQNVDMGDFVVASPGGLDLTMHPETQSRARTPRTRIADDVSVESGPATARNQTKSTAFSSKTVTSREVTSELQLLEQDHRIKTAGGNLMSALSRTPILNVERRNVVPVMQEKEKMLLTSSYNDLLEDFKEAAEASRFEVESQAPTATVADEDEIPFWERDTKTMTAEDEEDFDIAQAIWHLRKYLRNRFGSAQRAWAALESAMKPVDGTAVENGKPSLADTISVADLKIALGRLGIKLAHVTGYAFTKKMLASMDKNNTQFLSYIQLMGDEDRDRSLLADPPPAAKETWQTDLRQPRWEMNWEQGLFDKEMLECIITCDYHRPSQKPFKKPQKGPKGYKPVWQKYQEIMDERSRNRDEAIAQKREQEFAECTFEPDMEYSKKTGTRVLQQKRLRARSQPQKISVHERNMAKIVAACDAEDAECTFHPSVCSRSRLIYSNMIDSGRPTHVRLSEKDKAIEHLKKNYLDKKAPDSFIPDTSQSADYGIHHDRKKNIHERLFHHEKHEFWHGDERGLDYDAAKKQSIMPSWSGNTPSDDSRRSSPDQHASRISASSRHSEDYGTPSAVTVEYRDTYLGIMEACERWGSKADLDSRYLSRSASTRSQIFSHDRPTSAGSASARATPTASRASGSKARAAAKSSGKAHPLSSRSARSVPSF